MKIIKKELFKDIKIYESKSRQDNVMTKGSSTLGWKFTYKGTQYGNYIDNAIYDKPPEYEIGEYIPIVGIRDITPEEQIELFEKMVKLMKKLIKRGKSDGNRNKII